MSVTEPRISKFEAALLTVMFVVLITLPLYKQLVAGEPTTESIEGRRLNPLPEFSLKHALREFPGKFEAYYNDHFGFRAALLKVGGYVGVKYANVPLSSDVIIGKEGWLFKRYGQSMEDYRGGPLFTDAELDQWKRTLERKQEWLAKRGIQFLFVVAPEKQTIYPEFMPDKYSRLHDPTAGQQLVSYLKAHSTVHLLSLIEPVMEAKSKGGDRIYFRHDTHWNTLGAFVGYTTLMNRLHEWYPDLKPKDRSEFQLVMEYNKGDLARMMGMPEYSAGDEPTLKPIDAPKTTNTPFKVEGAGLLDERSFTLENDNARTKRKAVMMHESYTWALMPLLSADFEKVTYLFRFQDDAKFEKALAEAVRREKPDIFIEERVERYLLSPPPEEKIIFGGGE